MAKSRAERKAEKAELVAAQARAESAVIDPPKFDTTEEANAALSSVAKVFRMKTKEEGAMSKRSDRPKPGTSARLTSLPALPKGPAKAKPVKPCACGCSEMTKGTWAPGHDSNFRGWVLRMERGLMTAAKMKELGVPEATIAKVKAEVKLRAQSDGKQAASGQ